MTEPTMRQKLHAASSLVEVTASALDYAQRQYDAARNELNDLIDQLCPLDSPNGKTETLRVPVLTNKIALIKLVRQATADHCKRLKDETFEGRTRLDTTGSIVGSCMGLKDAKDLVDAYEAECLRVAKGDPA